MGFLDKAASRLEKKLQEKTGAAPPPVAAYPPQPYGQPGAYGQPPPGNTHGYPPAGAYPPVEPPGTHKKHHKGKHGKHHKHRDGSSDSSSSGQAGTGTYANPMQPPAGGPPVPGVPYQGNAPQNAGIYNAPVSQPRAFGGPPPPPPPHAAPPPQFPAQPQYPAGPYGGPAGPVTPYGNTAGPVAAYGNPPIQTGHDAKGHIKGNGKKKGKAGMKQKVMGKLKDPETKMKATEIATEFVAKQAVKRFMKNRF